MAHFTSSDVAARRSYFGPAGAHSLAVHGPPLFLDQIFWTPGKEQVGPVSTREQKVAERVCFQHFSWLLLQVGGTLIGDTQQLLIPDFSLCPALPQWTGCQLLAIAEHTATAVLNSPDWADFFPRTQENKKKEYKEA